MACTCSCHTDYFAVCGDCDDCAGEPARECKGSEVQKQQALDRMVIAIRALSEEDRFYVFRHIFTKQSLEELMK